MVNKKDGATKGAIPSQTQFLNDNKREDTSSVFVLSLITTFTIGLGLSVLILSIVYDVQDLYIVGPIFLIAGCGFFILLVMVCRSNYCSCFCKNKDSNSVSPILEKDALNEEYAISHESILAKDSPNAVQLYGADQIIHVPARVKSPPKELPPSPPVYFPNDPKESEAVTESTGYNVWGEKTPRDNPTRQMVLKRDSSLHSPIKTSVFRRESSSISPHVSPTHSNNSGTQPVSQLANGSDVHSSAHSITSNMDNLSLR